MPKRKYNKPTAQIERERRWHETQILARAARSEITGWLTIAGELRTNEFPLSLIPIVRLGAEAAYVEGRAGSFHSLKTRRARILEAKIAGQIIEPVFTVAMRQEMEWRHRSAWNWADEGKREQYFLHALQKAKDLLDHFREQAVFATRLKSGAALFIPLQATILEMLQKQNTLRPLSPVSVDLVKRVFPEPA